MYIYYIVIGSVKGMPEIFLDKNVNYMDNLGELGKCSPSESRWMVPNTVSIDD